MSAHSERPSSWQTTSGPSAVPTPNYRPQEFPLDTKSVDGVPVVGGTAIRRESYFSGVDDQAVTAMSLATRDSSGLG